MKELTVDRCRKQILRLKKCISEGYVSINERDYLQALETALPILEQQEQADRGWIEWGGGECPVEAQQSVEVKLRGAIENSNTASEFYWRHCQSRGDIIAYRIIPEQPTNQNGEQ